MASAAAQDAPGKEENASIGHLCFSDKLYAEVEKLYTDRSNHADLLCSFCESKLLPALKANRKENLSLLDVGAGPGRITRRLAEHFAKVEVIEPYRNPEYLATYAEAPPFVVNRASTVEDASIPPSAYDLILCSHILYHVPVDKWNNCLAKLHRGLRPSGRLVVVLTAPRGPWHELQLSLRPAFGSDLHTGTVRSKLDDMGIKYETCTVKSTVSVMTGDLAGFRDLVRLFSIADTWSASEWEGLGDEEKTQAEAKVERYIQTRCFRKETDEYVLKMDEDYVIAVPSSDSEGRGKK